MKTFVATIASDDGRIEGGTFTIDEIVFGTDRSTALCPPDALLPLVTSTNLPQNA